MGSITVQFKLTTTSTTKTGDLMRKNQNPRQNSITNEILREAGIKNLLTEFEEK
jgi:hypothetical protein